MSNYELSMGNFRSLLELYPKELDSFPGRQKAFEQLLCSLQRAKNPAGLMIHIDLSKLMEAYVEIEKQLGNSVGA